MAAGSLLYIFSPKTVFSVTPNYHLGGYKQLDLLFIAGRQGHLHFYQNPFHIHISKAQLMDTLSLHVTVSEFLVICLVAHSVLSHLHAESQWSFKNVLVGSWVPACVMPYF